MGWVCLALLMAAAFAAVLRLGVPRDLASFVGAALMLGAAGYALQGKPGLAGAAVSPASRTVEVDPNLSMLRNAMFGRYTVAESYFTAGDALIRSGNAHSAVGWYLGAINAQPHNAALWTALGEAYTYEDGGTVSPAARLAFARAIRLAPDHAGPSFFYGLALVRAGEFRAARGWWRRAYRLTPPAIGYRSDIGRRLTLLEAFLASAAGQSAR